MPCSEELELYPAFKEKLRKLNITSYVLSIYLCIMIGRCAPNSGASKCAAEKLTMLHLCFPRSNFILSCILILRDYSAGKTSEGFEKDMHRDTLMTGVEAVAHGLADNIVTRRVQE